MAVFDQNDFALYAQPQILVVGAYVAVARDVAEQQTFAFLDHVMLANNALN